MPAAAVRHLTPEESGEAWKGFVRQHGEPPWWDWPECRSMPPPLEGCDGTDTPALRNGDDHRASEQYGSKGTCFIHVIATAINGTVTDYAAAVLGTFQDSRISVSLLERLKCHKLSAVLDNGWRIPLAFPLPSSFTGDTRGYTAGMPLFMRPSKQGDTAPAGYQRYFERCSAYVTVARQHNEWANGSIKKQFPWLSQPRRYYEKESLGLDFETIVRLYNLRSRLIGYNQVRTTYMRYSNENFNEQLLAAKNCDEYLRMVTQEIRRQKKEDLGL